jgi:hypothetical protein
MVSCGSCWQGSKGSKIASMRHPRKGGQGTQNQLLAQRHYHLNRLKEVAVFRA